ncbi:MAG: universal stress protein [Acidobacteriota bacterium]
MQRFKNILAIYNRAVGDEATLRRATLLAKNNGARLTVAEVADLPDSLISATDAASRRLAQTKLDERQEHLERLIVSIESQGVEVRAEVLVGTAFLEITRAVLRDHHDLVMMTAEEPKGLRNLLFGSTSMHLMRKCPSPVWVTKPGQSPRYARILAAVETFSSGEPYDALNKLIMDLAVSLARLEEGELHVVHAWEMTPRDIETSRSEISPTILEQLVRRNREAHGDSVEALLSGYNLEGLKHEVHLQQGEARAVIPRVAMQLGVDVLVMGTVCRTGIPGFFIGNTAEDVLKQVDCSVLTVKPAGFVTPVTLEPSS